MQTEPAATVDKLVEHACTGGDPTDLSNLAKAHPGVLRPFHRRLVNAGVWQLDLFYDMDERTAEYIVELIDGGHEAVGRLLAVLVTTPTATAVTAVARWQAAPPAWAATLYWPVREYPHLGGWELDGADGIRHLTRPDAFALLPGDGPGISGGTIEEHCAWCGMPLWRVLDIDDLIAATCVRCGCYTTVFTEGSGRWAMENARPNFIGHIHDTGEMPEDLRLHVGPARITPWSGNAWGAGGSTLGGLADWIQDAEYPRCPRCERTMTYQGMITGEDLWGGWAEGCHYVFTDIGCRLSAVIYQQS